MKSYMWCAGSLAMYKIINAAIKLAIIVYLYYIIVHILIRDALVPNQNQFRICWYWYLCNLRLEMPDIRSTKFPFQGEFNPQLRAFPSDGLYCAGWPGELCTMLVLGACIDWLCNLTSWMSTTRIVAHEDDYCDKINVYIQVYDKPSSFNNSQCSLIHIVFGTNFSFALWGRSILSCFFL